MKTLILYWTKNEQTYKIARFLKENIDCDCHLLKIDENLDIELSDYKTVIIGSAVYYGVFPKAVREFVSNNLNTLNKMQSAFFAVSLLARKSKYAQADTNPYVSKFIRKSGWNPVLTAVFAGALQYPLYNVLDKFMIRLIMMMTKGPTDPSSEIEFTKWDQVKIFAKEINMIEPKLEHKHNIQTMS